MINGQLTPRERIAVANMITFACGVLAGLGLALMLGILKIR